MIILQDFNEGIQVNTAVTIGKFDGLHTGHELLMSKILEQDGLESFVFSFVESPNVVLNQSNEKKLITNEERIYSLDRQGISYLMLCEFSQIMSLEPEDFIEILVERFHMKYLVCGDDFHFGKYGKGDCDLLKELSLKYHFTLEVVKKISDGEREISSTYVREEIAKGNVAHANELLGYPYFIHGRIVHGNHIGTTIGIPTINMIPSEEKFLPKFGVYVTEVEIDHRTYHGVTNIGVKPTVSGENKVGVETNILDFREDAYEKEAKVTFLEFLRDEKKFSTVEELQEQMRKDKRRAREYFVGK